VSSLTLSVIHYFSPQSEGGAGGGEANLSQVLLVFALVKERIHAEACHTRKRYRLGQDGFSIIIVIVIIVVIVVVIIVILMCAAVLGSLSRFALSIDPVKLIIVYLTFLLRFESVTRLRTLLCGLLSTWGSRSFLPFRQLLVGWSLSRHRIPSHDRVPPCDRLPSRD
jgi:hypothetical protein